MKFDIAKSKLYGELMLAFASFFKLGDDATETDIHAAIDGKKPLADQLEAARTDAVKELQSQFDTLKTDFDKQAERITALEQSVADAAAAATVKDARITELQTEIAGHAKTVDALKTQHKTEIDNLAGQLASAKAGKTQEHDAGGDQHEAAKLKSSTGATVVVARSGALDNLLKVRN